MRKDEETLARRGVDLLDPRSSHLQLRCRRCGATWRPRRNVEKGTFEHDYWKCWRGCNEKVTGDG